MHTERIRALYCLLLAYSAVSKDILAMPWTARLLALTQAELDALRADNIRLADSLSAATANHMKLLPA